MLIRGYSDVVIRDSVVARFQGSDLGGGILVEEQSALALENVVMVGNAARRLGGALHIVGSSLRLLACNLSGNAVVAGSGGGGGGGGSGGSGGSSSRGGGAVSLLSSALVASGLICHGNRAMAYGGCLLSLYSSLSLAASSLNGNSATAGGGALALRGDSDATLADCSFALNSAEDGGAVLSSSSALRGGSLFRGNRALGGDGGALWLQDSQVTLDASTRFSDCSALAGGGGALFWEGDAEPQLASDVQRFSSGNAAAYGPFRATPATHLVVQGEGDQPTPVWPPLPAGLPIEPEIRVALLDFYQQLVTTDNDTAVSAMPSQAFVSATVAQVRRP